MESKLNKTPTITSGLINIQSCTSTISVSSIWGLPQRVEVNEYTNSIEMVYIETSSQTLVYNIKDLQTRVYKIIFSCLDGKWNKSEKIYGKIIPASKEYYEFEN